MTALTRAWLDSRRDAVAGLADIAEALRENGDPEYAYYADFQRAVHRALAGVGVREVADEFGTLIARVNRSGHNYPNPEGCFRPYRLLLELQDSAALESQAGEIEAWLSVHPGAGETFVRTFWVMTLCIFGRARLAFEQSERVGVRLLRGLPFVHIADHMFYRGVAASSLAWDSRGASRSRYLRELRAARAWLSRWARYSPDLVHMEGFLAAEVSDHRGRREESKRLYERCFERAVSRGFLHMAALASERGAQAAARHERRSLLSADLGMATQFYQRWGATGKVELLRQRYGVSRQPPLGMRR